MQYPPHKQTKQPDQQETNTTSCSTTKCRYCPLINTSGTITSTFTSRTYTSKINVDCKSNNLIYCITCKVCHIQYVGQTKRRLMDRFQGHLYNITCKNLKDTIGHHFNSDHHNGISDLEIHIVDFIHANPNTPWSLELRRTIERNWQHRLRTIAPQGLNIQE